jgi:protein-disulfide isomerase
VVEPQLVRDFVSTGQVLFEYRDYAFLGDESVEAAEAALCANDQGLFWEMHDAIFYNQVGENDGAFARARLDRIAETVEGLDPDAWGQCMDDDTHEDDVQEARDNADDLGVSGTPSFLVDGQLLFGASYDELSQRIQAALGESTAP